MADQLTDVPTRLALVDRLLAGETDEFGGLWPRAAAWILRLAIEQCLRGLWTDALAPLAECNMRIQLLALTAFVDRDIAGATSELWHALSHVTHYRDYELAPALTELRAWRATAGLVVAGIQSAR